MRKREKIKKYFLCAFLMLCCIGMTGMQVNAASESQDGLEIVVTCDKDAYEENEQITATLQVENKNDFTINTVSLKMNELEGYNVSEKSDGIKTVEALEAGKKFSTTVTYIPKKNIGAKNNNQEKSKNEGIHTGDQNKIIFYIIAGIISMGCVVIIIRKKNRKQITSFFVCVILGGTLCLLPYVSVRAEESKMKTIPVSKEVTVSGKSFLINAIVEYEINKKAEKPVKPENPSETDDYYWNNAEVIDYIDAKESENVQSEKEVIEFLKSKGLGDYPITYNYSIDGEYDEDMEALEDKEDKHPMYSTYYISKTNEAWGITVVNGQIIANPISFNLESTLNAEVLISETSEITSYDNKANKFYVTIPKESAVIVKKIGTIDTETLDKLTSEEVNNL